MDVSFSLTSMYVLQEQFSVDRLGKVFVVEDRNSEKYVAVAENVGRSLTALSTQEVSTEAGKMVRVRVTTVLNPETPLPVIVRDVKETVICRTLGEAY
jgi:hypothetical protein